MLLTDTAEIAAPIDAVWALTVDVEAWPELMPTVTSVELLDPAPLRIGSRARIKQPAQRSRVWTVSELTADGDRRRFSWAARMGPIHMEGRHVLEATAGGCRNRLELELTGRFAGAFGLVARPLLARTLRTENASFRARAEAPDRR